MKVTNVEIKFFCTECGSPVVMKFLFATYDIERLSVFAKRECSNCHSKLDIVDIKCRPM